MARKRKRGRPRLHSMHKAGFAGPLKKRGRKKKSKFTAKQLAHHASMKHNPIRKRNVVSDVAKHMKASIKRGLHQIDSVAEHMMKSMSRGHK